jgi:hypothetical protein
MTLMDAIEQFTGERAILDLRVERIQQMPLGLECVVNLSTGDLQFEACIPIDNVVNYDPPTVKGALVAVEGDSVIFAFPPSSLGTAVWSIPKSSISEFALQE